MMTRDTQVSRTNPLVKRILAATVGDFRGKVVVREVPYGWTHTEYIDDHSKWFYLSLVPDVRVHHIPDRPTMRVPAYAHPAPQSHEVFVHLWRSMGKQGVELIVSEEAIDASTIAVATDALLEGDKKAAAEVVAGMGPMAGMGLAIAEAHAKALKKGERGEVPKRPKTARQLDREIAAALARRG